MPHPAFVAIGSAFWEDFEWCGDGEIKHGPLTLSTVKYGGAGGSRVRLAYDNDESGMHVHFDMWLVTAEHVFNVFRPLPPTSYWPWWRRLIWAVWR